MLSMNTHLVPKTLGADGFGCGKWTVDREIMIITFNPQYFALRVSDHLREFEEQKALLPPTCNRAKEVYLFQHIWRGWKSG